MSSPQSATHGALLLDFLCSQTPQTLEKLHNSIGSTLAIFRFLPQVQQLFVSRLAFVSEPLPISLLESWLQPKHAAEVHKIVKNLEDLRILLKYTDDVMLSPNFQSSIQSGLTGASGNVSGFLDISSTIEEKHKKSVKDLGVYATERWESLLQFLALPSERTQQSVSPVMREVLKSADFIQESDGRGKAASFSGDGILNEVEITSAGFKFLLMERTNQIWTYILEYLKFIAEKKDEEFMVDCLSYLLGLSFCSPGHSYSNQAVKESLGDFVQHLRELGLLYMRKRKDGWFYSTPLVSHLSGSTTGAGTEKANQGFLMIETNYRVYAYTNSVLQLAILSTFCDIVYRFSNLSVGVLTRESARNAFQVGITSEQIIDYLRSHAHEKMLEKVPILPSSITDQIRLWEFERDRLQFEHGMHYSNFDSDKDYQVLKAFSAEQNITLWQEDKSRQLIVSEEGHNMVKQFWKKQRKS